MQNVSTFPPQPGQTTVGEMRQPQTQQMVPRAGEAARAGWAGGDTGGNKGREKRRCHLCHRHCSCWLQLGQHEGQAMSSDRTSRMDVLEIW